MNVLVYALTLFGFCYIVGHSAISRPVREAMNKKAALRWLLVFIECPACLSFWIGLIVAVHDPSYAQSVATSNAILFAIFSCGVSAVLGLFTGLME